MVLQNGTDSQAYAHGRWLLVAMFVLLMPQVAVVQAERPSQALSVDEEVDEEHHAGQQDKHSAESRRLLAEESAFVLSAGGSSLVQTRGQNSKDTLSQSPSDRTSIGRDMPSYQEVATAPAAAAPEPTPKASAEDADEELAKKQAQAELKAEKDGMEKAKKEAEAGPATPAAKKPSPAGADSFPDGYPVKSRVKVTIPLPAEVVEPYDKNENAYTVKLQKAAWNKEVVNKKNVQLVEAYKPPKKLPGSLDYSNMFKYADDFEAKLNDMSDKLIKDDKSVKGKTDDAVEKHNKYVFLLWKNHVLGESLKRNIDQFRAAEAANDEHMEAVFDDLTHKANDEANLHIEVGEKYRHFMDDRMKDMDKKHEQEDIRMHEIMTEQHPEPKAVHDVLENKLPVDVPDWVVTPPPDIGADADHGK